MGLKRAEVGWLLGWVALVGLVYLPTLRGGFVYDSIAQVLYDDTIHQPSRWADLLTLRVLGQDTLDSNRPLHLASLMLDSALWGREPFGYRLTSVLLHGLNTGLLFLFLLRVLGGQRGQGALALGVAAFGALLFSLNPLVVEAVAEPSNREDLLILFPLLAGMLLILYAGPESPRIRRWLNLALVALAFLGVLAKESGVALPVIFAVAVGLFRPADFWRCLPGLVAGLGLNTAYLGVAYWLRPETSAVFLSPPQPLAGDFLTGAAVQLRIWTLQLGQVIWPANLSAHYPGESVAGISLPLAVLVVAGGVAAAGWLGKKDRLFALGAAVYVFALLPASNLLPQYHPVADRFLYVPLAGAGMAAAALVARVRWNDPRFRAWMLVGLAGLLGWEGVANQVRQRVWQEPASLWADVLRQYPRNGQALVGMANVRWRAGDYEGAREKAGEAVVASQGRWAEAWALQAVCDWKSGRKSEARDSLQVAGDLSRPYQNSDSILRMLFLSPDQAQILLEILKNP